MTVKESFNVAGLATTFGNPQWKDNIATGNAFLIDRLQQAGAIVFGKTNVPYMLADAQSYNDIYGTTNNPWDLTRSPGAQPKPEPAPSRLMWRLRSRNNRPPDRMITGQEIGTPAGSQLRPFAARS
jgi:hypothetical protein